MVSDMSKHKYYPEIEAEIFLLSRNVKRTRVCSISSKVICPDNFSTLFGNDYDLNCQGVPVLTIKLVLAFPLLGGM